ncbi:hypothetical protein AGMMS49928_15450 [Spirochaetia bacterium]|nr:hypothetical protein AGMMS49928_15450 [Spirochaetia bacterium]
MKKILIFTVLGALILTGLEAQTGGKTLYVAVKSAPVKASADIFAETKGNLAQGQAVTVVSENAKWTQVRVVSPALAGWISTTSLTSRRPTSSGNRVNTGELALAGKGLSFSSEMEQAYKSDQKLSYDAIDRMEAQNVDGRELLKFITDGKLNRGDKPGSAYSLQQPVNDMYDEITMEEAYYMGRTVGARVLSAYKIYTNAALTAYLNNICQTIVINSPRPLLFNGYHVLILDTPEINALATPGGHIFISRGLVEAATSEDMLAAVIAHEISHIQLEHGLESVKLFRLTENAADARRSGIALQGKQDDPKILFMQTIAESVDTLTHTGYSREQEFEADAKAADLLVLAGYQPSGLLDLLKILPRSGSGGWYSTHPAPSARISAVEGIVPATWVRQNNNAAVRAARFRTK